MAHSTHYRPGVLRRLSITILVLPWFAFLFTKARVVILDISYGRPSLLELWILPGLVACYGVLVTFVFLVGLLRTFEWITGKTYVN